MPDLVDAVVVGGGIVGAAMTLALAQRNLRVLLLEAQRLGSGATGSGFAWVNATYKADEDAAYFHLNAEGVACYDRLAGEWEPERTGIYGGGALFWAHRDDPATQERLRRQAHLLQAWNYPAALLSNAELAVLEPHISCDGETDPTIENAVLFAPNDKWVDTARLCRLFVEQAQKHKAHIRLDCPALGFTRNATNAISTVETAQGRIATHTLVLAAGLETPRLAALVTGDPSSGARLPLRPEPGLLLETPPLPPGSGCSHILYPPDAGGLHLRPTSEGGVLIGAEDLDAWLLESVQAQGLPQTAAHVLEATTSATLRRGLLDRAARWLPDIPTADLYRQSLLRLCVRPVPADGYPIVGALPGVPGAYVAVMHSGITLGPLLTELLANEIVTHTLSPRLARYRPDRFPTVTH